MGIDSTDKLSAYTVAIYAWFFFSSNVGGHSENGNKAGDFMYYFDSGKKKVFRWLRFSLVHFVSFFLGSFSSSMSIITEVIGDFFF